MRKAVKGADKKEKKGEVAVWAEQIRGERKKEKSAV